MKIQSFDVQIIIFYRVQKRWQHKLHSFEYHVSVEHDDKHPQPKFGENRSNQLWTKPIYTHFNEAN